MCDMPRLRRLIDWANCWLRLKNVTVSTASPLTDLTSAYRELVHGCVYCCTLLPALPAIALFYCITISFISFCFTAKLCRKHITVSIHCPLHSAHRSSFVKTEHTFTRRMTTTYLNIRPCSRMTSRVLDNKIKQLMPFRHFVKPKTANRSKLFIS